MNESGKRGRGRPRGTGLNDMPVLMMIADMIAREPRLPATTALRRIDPDINAASKRRIQSKWHDLGSALLAEAQRRLAPKKSAPAPAPAPKNVNRGIEHARRLFGDALGMGMPPLTASQLAAAEVARQLAAGLNQASVGRSAFSAAQTAYEAYNSPSMRAVREAYDSPTMRAARELYDSPTMRAMREVHDSPTMRAMRELQDSPTMRALRDAQAMLVGIRG